MKKYTLTEEHRSNHRSGITISLPRGWYKVAYQQDYAAEERARVQD